MGDPNAKSYKPLAGSEKHKHPPPPLITNSRPITFVVAAPRPGFLPSSACSTSATASDDDLTTIKLALAKLPLHMRPSPSTIKAACRDGLIAHERKPRRHSQPGRPSHTYLVRPSEIRRFAVEMDKLDILDK